jgi:autotransporter-associated beta strand protein
MKPQKHNSILRSMAGISLAAFVISPSLQAATGTWTGTTTAANWSDTAQWTAGIVADGANETADFSTVDLPAGAFAVNLDASRTIGNLTLGDADLATPATWSLTNAANTLTLAGTTKPVITANISTTINSFLAGSSGFTKSGSANLILAPSPANSPNTITGNISVTAGQLTTKNGGAIPAANTLTLNNGTTYRYERIGSTSTFQGFPITVAATSSVNITTDNAGNGYSGVITGDANSQVTIGASGNTAQCSFSAGANTQQFGPFLGTVNIFDGASIRFSSTSALANGGASTIFNIGVGSDFTARNSGTVHVGALTGVGTLSGSSGATGTTIFSIGGKGIDSTYAGVIRDAATGTRFAAVTKVGTAKLTLTGTNTYTGATALNAGIIDIGGGGVTGALANTTVTIAAAGSLHLNRSDDFTLPGVVAGAGGIVKKATGSATLAATNTFSGGISIEAGKIIAGADANLGNIANAININGNGGLSSNAASFSTARQINLATGFTGSLSASSASNSLISTGLITGAGNLLIDGAGVVDIAGTTNNYSGTTTISSGTLNISNASGSATSSGTVAVNGGALSGTGTISGAVTVDAAGSLKPGSVTPTSSDVGTLNLSSLTLSGGATIYQEFDTASSYDVTNVTTADGLTSTASIGNPILVDVRVKNSVAKWTTLGTYNIIAYSGTFAGNANDLFEVTSASQESGLSYTFNASAGFITLTISGAQPPTWNVDADGSWTTASNWDPSSPNSSGIKAIFGGMISSPRTVTLDAAKTVGKIEFNNANSYTISGANTLTLNNGALASDITVFNGSHSIASNLALASTLELNIPLNSTLTLGGVVSGSNGIKKVGNGNLTLAGNNTFSGPVELSNGSTLFANGGLGASGSTLLLTDTTLVWDIGNTQDISSKTVTLANNVIFDTNGNNVTLANDIVGTSNLTKAGEGILTLTADNSLTGDVTISAGALKLGNGALTGFLIGNIINNSELILDLLDSTPAEVSVSNTISGSGSLSHVGSGVTLLGGANTFSGNTTIAAGGTLKIGNSVALQNSTLDYASTGGTLDFGSFANVTLGNLTGDKNLTLDNNLPGAVALTVGGNNSTQTYSGILSGTGSLTKTGTGTLVLAGVNTYTGATTVNTGAIELPTGGKISTTTCNAGGQGLINITGGELVASAASVVQGGGTLGLRVSDGTASFNGGLTSNANDGTMYLISGGTLNANFITLRRTANFTDGANPTPANASATSGLVITGGQVNVTTNLNIGTENSGSSVLVDGGYLTVSGKAIIGNAANTRWSLLEVKSGNFSAPSVTEGVVLSPHNTVANKGVLLVTGGTAVVGRVGFGEATSAAGIGRVDVKNGGALYVGSGGMVQLAPTFTSQIYVNASTLGAAGDWSTTLPMTLTGAVVLSSESPTNTPHTMTLNGALTGAASIEKTGAGTVVLAAANNYDGDTTVTAGTLSIASASLNDLRDVYVQSGTILDLTFTGVDNVNAFYINGVAQNAGTWGAIGSAADHTSALITGTGMIEVSPPGYLAWATDVANGLSAGANQAETADPDNDGISNLLEFVLGGLPMSSSQAPLPDQTFASGNQTFTFTREDDSEAEVTLVVQHSTDLLNWTDVTIPAAEGTTTTGTPVATVVVSENGTDPDTITISIPQSATTRFMRLKATK